MASRRQALLPRAGPDGSVALQRMVVIRALELTHHGASPPPETDRRERPVCQIACYTGPAVWLEVQIAT